MTITNNQEWLLIFYNVPSIPVSNRMKIWRKLSKIGAVQLKGAVYILPATEEHEELLQWIIVEVKSMGGDGAIVKSDEIKPMTDADIRLLFTVQVDAEYRRLEKSLGLLERRIRNSRKTAKNDMDMHLAESVGKITKEFVDARKRDYFNSSMGQDMMQRVQALATALRSSGMMSPSKENLIAAKRIPDYQSKKWATRKNPFVDRMASAWLIRRFIDPRATFLFIDEREISGLDAGTATFDMRDAAFAHVGDLCTFEVLVQSFGIRDGAVKKIAEVVHDMDFKDDKYGKPETAGVEEILTGIRKTAKDDADCLERGMTAFEMLYQAKRLSTITGSRPST